MTKKVFIKTLGCQMNSHDSARVKDLFLQKGWVGCDKAIGADLVLFNTCSVRQHAEDRVFANVALLKKFKEKNPSMIIGLLGCMAETYKDDIFRRLPHLDFVCGPACLDKVPQIVERIKSGAGHIVYVEGIMAKRIPDFSKDRIVEKRAHVKIMEGCSNFCSYCIVPYVRGTERSRPSKEILSEVKALLDTGVTRITLLGQNVNSYGRGLKERVSFSELLRMIDEIASAPETKKRRLPAMTRGKVHPLDEVGIDFVTSHPKDAKVEMFKVMAECRAISKQLHLPLQSGSDKILKKMNRNYTVGKYKKLVKDFRRIVKGGKIITDLIVGFPGETEKDFNDTLNAVKEIKFDAAYIFKYSPRPFTKAGKLKDDVAKDEKERRHRVLLDAQKEISRRKLHITHYTSHITNRDKIYFLIGPTASGKTGLSIKLAEKLNAEIISCDSMAVYKDMDIMTSKPSAAIRRKIKHYLIDIISPAREFSAAEYRERALKAIEDILRHGKTPLFVGGSGLYVKAVIDGFFPSGEKDAAFRKQQEKLAEKYGNDFLYNKLKRIDPVTAKKIHPNNLRRIVRALEIFHTEKKRPSELKKNTLPLKYKFKIYGLDIDKEALYDNINARVDKMFEQGIVDEVKGLSKKRLSMTAKGALGYKEVLGYVKGEYSLEEAKGLLKKNTRNFAKRQMTWFSADKRIEWKKPYLLQ